nr:FtsQ-type POTRA domain-containing protein [Propionibacterium sp.]
MTGPLVDLNGRVRDRAREARRRRRTLLVRVAAVAAVLATLGWVLTGSALVSVRTIEVTGNQSVAADTITQAAGIALGTPLARVDTAAASRRLAGVPGIARGDVTVVLPDKVSIRVTERAVAFVVAVEGGAFAWIDPTGLSFGQSRERPAGVPLAVVANPNDQQLMADVATVAGALPARLTERVQQITAQTRDSIVVETTAGTSIVWGSTESSSLKGQVADALESAQPRCRRIDVSSPTHPTTRC